MIQNHYFTSHRCSMLQQQSVVIDNQPMPLFLSTVNDHQPPSCVPIITSNHPQRSFGIIISKNYQQSSLVTITIKIRNNHHYHHHLLSSTIAVKRVHYTFAIVPSQLSYRRFAHAVLLPDHCEAPRIKIPRARCRLAAKKIMD